MPRREAMSLARAGDESRRWCWCCWALVKAELRGVCCGCTVSGAWGVEVVGLVGWSSWSCTWIWI